MSFQDLIDKSFANTLKNYGHVISEVTHNDKLETKSPKNPEIVKETNALDEK